MDFSLIRTQYFHYNRIGPLHSLDIFGISESSTRETKQVEGNTLNEYTHTVQSYKYKRSLFQKEKKNKGKKVQSVILAPVPESVSGKSSRTRRPF